MHEIRIRKQEISMCPHLVIKSLNRAETKMGVSMTVISNMPLRLFTRGREIEGDR